MSYFFPNTGDTVQAIIKLLHTAIQDHKEKRDCSRQMALQTISKQSQIKFKIDKKLVRKHSSQPFNSKRVEF